MKITVNDLAFMFPFYEETEFWSAVKQFIQVCRELESVRCHSVDGITRVDIDKNIEIYPNVSLYKVIQRITNKDERKYFLGLLVNGEENVYTQKAPFLYKGKCSYVCAAAKEQTLVSLESDEGLKNTEVEGEIDGAKVSIRNISREFHIHCYRELLGLRIYAANDKKHKKDRLNPYGRGKIGSPMDLSDQAAQQLLDHAIWIKNRLYARKGTVNYAFQNTRACIYHGYIADDLGDDILTILHSKKWD